ncbi:MAG: B12-binding domain-containing radical SAM protein [Magnetovibrio sp.]|nr:B12-binding domain-containing radical SAM protein [Magnetovibrio sp.]
MNEIVANPGAEDAKTAAAVGDNGERYPSFAALRERRTYEATGTNVALVHPGHIDQHDTDIQMHGELSNASSSQPPQGLCLLAAIVKEFGYNPCVIDAEPFGLDVASTARLIMEHNPRYVGMTSYTPTIVIASQLALELKRLAAEKGQEITIIIGGPHVTFRSEDALTKFQAFDIGVYGEGEISIVELLDALEQGEPLDDIPNLVFRRDDEVIRTKRRSSLMDMDELPLPAWDMLPSLKDNYHPAGDNMNRLPGACITTSRGCPAKCYFCNPRSLGSGFRGNSAEYIVRMFEQLHFDYGIRDIFMSDDMFTFDRDNVLRFCELLKQSKADVTWSCFCRVDYVDEEMLAAMKSAGCWQIGFGLESGSQDVLVNINKNQSTELMEHAIRITHEAGIGVRGMFMVGGFGETHETIKETLAFIKRNPIHYFHISFFTPYPGTPAFKLAPRYGEYLESAGDESDLTSHDPSFVPHGLTVEEMIAYQKLMYRTLIKPVVVWNYFKKMRDPLVARRIIKGALAFFKYVLKPTRNKKYRVAKVVEH